MTSTNNKVKINMTPYIPSSITPQSTDFFPSGAVNTSIAKAIDMASQPIINHWHFVYPEDVMTSSFELMKVLHRHQKDQRWTLLIAPHHIPSKIILNCYNINMKHTLIIKETQFEDLNETIISALQHPTIGSILAWHAEWHKLINSDSSQQITELADQHQCHVYAFHLPKSTMPHQLQLEH